MQVFDVLSGKKKSIKESELVFSKQKNLNYVVSIPHGGTLIPFGMEKKLIIEGIGCDPFTKDLYNFNKGIYVISNINAHLLNMNRAMNGLENSNYEHLRSDPFHNSITGKRILRKEYSEKQKEQLLTYYKKYHSLIESSIEKVLNEQGFVLLFDCHFLASVGPKKAPDSGRERPDIVVGTLDGKSAGKKIIDVFLDKLKEKCDNKFNVEKNYPYKGGFIIQNYSNPDKNIHGIGIEVNRKIYMNEKNNKPKQENIKMVNNLLEKTINPTLSEINS